MTADHAVLGDHKAVSIEVADTGCGIPAAEIARIWDPYVTEKPGVRVWDWRLRARRCSRMMELLRQKAR